MKLSVRTKLTIVMAVFLIAALIASTLANAVAFRRQFTEAMQSQAFAVGRIVSTQLQHILSLGIPLDELIGFEVQCREAVEAYDGVAYVEVVGLDGRVLFHSQPEPMSDRVQSGALLDAVASGAEAIVDTPGKNEDYFDAIVPVRSAADPAMAAIRVGVDRAVVAERVDRLVRNVILVGGGCLLLALGLLMLVINRLVVRPLRRIDTSIQVIGSVPRDLGHTMPVSSRDEFGNIATAFNNMLKALKTSRSEIERYTSHLEEKVAERTRELEIANQTLQEDIHKREKVEVRLHHIAHHDPLTGLPNRAYVTEYLEKRVSHAKRHGSALAVLFLDLDGFKYINDTFGHSQGDALLVETGRRLRERLRTEDLIARLGGDEFIVIVEDISDGENVAQMASDLIQALVAPVNIDEQELIVTASIGISVFPNDGPDSTELLKNADVAMYRAKSLGRNRYQFYTAEMNESWLDRLVLGSELRRALTNNELELYYQPRVRLSDGVIQGVEALLRWNHPVHGIMLPGQFLDIAESTGLIVPIGEWVLKEACTALSRWNDGDLANVTIAVNVSEQQVFQERFAQVVDKMLESASLPAGRLELEITENILMHNIGSAIQVLNALHNNGVHISIDDFGTGYSSLYRLKSLPVNCLKIDKTFIRDLPGDDSDTAIVRTVLSLGRSLGLTVIAEGVETEAQSRCLSKLGCDEAQGFLFGRPMAEADLLQQFAYEAKAVSLTGR